LKISAEVVAYSRNTATGHTVTSFLLTYPRYVHAELMTHRVFSRNSASSRAIPVSRMLRDVWKNPVVPVRFGSAKKGMQDGGALPPWRAWLCRRLWLAARYPAIAAAWLLHRMGLHKQITNRVLEPWMWITVLVTATDWRNFYRLRLHPAAQPEMQELARVMLELHRQCLPRPLMPGQWHLPFVTDEDRYTREPSTLPVVCTAAAARTSYTKALESKGFEDDKRLHDQLRGNGHASPFEHACEAMPDDRRYGNLRAFRSYRLTLPGEANDDGSPFDPAALADELGLPSLMYPVTRA
jgi:hypothetical protein